MGLIQIWLNENSQISFALIEFWAIREHCFSDAVANQYHLKNMATLAGVFHWQTFKRKNKLNFYDSRTPLQTNCRMAWQQR